MNRKSLTHFEPDPELQEYLRPCMDHYGIGDPNAEWPNNMLSRKTVVYGSGRIARAGDVLKHAVDAEELQLCKTLAQEVAEIMADIEVGMGSKSSDYFSPFFITANVDDPVPDRINADLIGARFGGVIFPPTPILVEPLREAGLWWSETLSSCEEDSKEEREEYLHPWRTMIRWFQKHPDIRSPSFVRIGDARSLRDLADLPRGSRMVGSVFPRLVLGLTHRGSLVGLFGVCVQT
jgi:hypothetical protein